MREWWRSMFAERRVSAPRELDEVRELRDGFVHLDDESLKRAARRATRLPEIVAVTAVVVSRVLGLQMFDEQLEGALALAHGRIVEMQTGEGKTLAAVPAVAWYARGGAGVHVLTVNDYLAGRDAAWMGEAYRWLGLSVAAVAQDMTLEDRRPTGPTSPTRPPKSWGSTICAIGSRFILTNRCCARLPPR